MPKSLPYHPFLIQSLKNPIDSAMYLEAFFEEENPEAELLKMVLSNVAEALGKQQMSPEQYEVQFKKLDELLSQQGSDAIYNLGTWLNALGLKLTVALGKQQMSPKQYELHLKKLDELLSQQGSDAIYNLGTWLNALGLKLTVAVCTDTEDNTANAETRSHLTV